MTAQPELHNIPLRQLTQRCAEESERFFNRRRNDPRFCYELFRRAIVGRDQDAWETLYRQYRPLVTGWVERHASFLALGEESQYFVNGAFSKMWQVLTPQKFARFPELKSILRYLQMCVHSVIIDAVRTRDHSTFLEDEGLELQRIGNPDAETVEAGVLERAQGEALWRELNLRLKDEKERRVVYGCFVLALKPGQLFKQSSGAFADVQEIYRVKENLIARLRRDDELRSMFDDS